MLYELMDGFHHILQKRGKSKNICSSNHVKKLIKSVKLEAVFYHNAIDFEE